MLHLGADHIHADPATGNLAQVVRGGEARLENELRHGFVGRLSRGIQQAAFDRLLADLQQVQAAAIVGDFHHQLCALATQPHIDAPVLGLAGGDACLGRFDAVINRVA